MLRNYIKIAFRNLFRNKLFSLINILGLSVGIASCILISLFVFNELKYDKYHENADDIYRIVLKSNSSGERWSNLPGIMLPALEQNLPELETVVRFRSAKKCVLSIDNNHYVADNFMRADSTVLDVFSWELLRGNPQSALTEPNHLLVSESAAKKYFGDTDPLGKIVKFNHAFKFVITGIFKDIPEHSHLKFDFLGSLYSLQKINNDELSSWNNQGMYFYLKFPGPIVVNELQDKIKTSVIENGGERFEKVDFQLQAMKDIYLHSSDVSRDSAKRGNIMNVYGFSIVALLILIIACFNYMNLSTARAKSRAKEVGIRKVIGANSRKLAVQFIGESFMISFISFFIAIILVEILINPFNELLGKNLNLYAIPIWQLAIIVFSSLLIISLFAGSYPAFILSRFQAIKVIKGINLNNSHRSFFTKILHLYSRQGLVVLQFAVAVALIIASNIVYKQLDLIRNMDLGVHPENLIIINNPWDSEMARRYDNFKISISSNPEIRKVSAATNIPPGYINNYAHLRPADAPEENVKTIGVVSVDSNFLKSIGATLLEGQDFEIEHRGENSEFCIINVTAAKMLELDEPIGTLITGFYNNSPKTIIGVVKDIQFNSVHEKTDGVAFFVQKKDYPPYTRNILVKVKSQNIKSTLEFMEKEWNKIAPQWPIQYFFMDQQYEKLYRTENNTGKLLRVFTLLAVLISFSGLFGLMLFIVESKTKGIGIRKVFGVSTNTITRNLLREFFRLILIANMLAWPIVYYIMDKWMANFEHKASIKPTTFIYAGLATFVIAFLTVYYHTQKAAKANPIEALKYE